MGDFRTGQKIAHGTSLGEDPRYGGLADRRWKIGPGTSLPAKARGGFEDELPGGWLSVARGVQNLEDTWDACPGVGGLFRKFPESDGLWMVQMPIGTELLVVVAQV